MCLKRVQESSGIIDDKETKFKIHKVTFMTNGKYQEEVVIKIHIKDVGTGINIEGL